MAGDLDSEAERRHPLPVAGISGCNHQLTPSNCDASYLTTASFEDFFRRSENVTQGGCMAWTNEKHNSYLYHLEMSFVKQFYQSKSVLAHSLRHNLTEIDISRKRLITVHNASEKYNVLQDGCWQKINCAMGEPISCSTSADSHASLESKQGKGIRFHGVQKCSQEFSSSNICNGDLIDLTEEGTGQNFLDEDNESALNFESRAKRLKIGGIVDGSHQVPVLSDCTFQGMPYVRLFCHLNVRNDLLILNPSPNFDFTLE